MRLAAATGLEKIGPLAADAVATLMLAVDDPDVEVRKCAMAALGKIGMGAAAAVPKLVPILDSEEWDIRAAAANALTNIQTDEAQKAISQYRATFGTATRPAS